MREIKMIERERESIESGRRSKGNEEKHIAHT